MPTSHNNHSNQSSHHSYHQSPHRNQEPVSQGNQHSTPVQQQQQQQQAGQPVEFNHAINYVNKIKVKFVIVMVIHNNRLGNQSSSTMQLIMSAKLR